MKHFKNIYKILENQKLLFVIFIIALIIPNFILIFTENVSFLTKVCNVILPLSFFWFLMTLTSRPGKMTWILFIFLFFAAFQLVLLYLFGEAVIAVDMFLNLVTTNSGEATELLSNLLPAVITVVIFFVSILTFAVFSIKNKQVLSKSFRLKQRLYSIILFVVSSILVLGNYLTNESFKLLNDIYPLNVCTNVCLAVKRDSKSRSYYKTSKDFKFNAHSKHDKDERELYIFVVGETARPINWGLYGYNRNTTPELDRIKDDLVIYKDALTQSNTTHKSVPMLLSDASAEDYECIYSHKSMIDAFNEAGFHTLFLSNQRPNHSFIDYFAEEADKDIFIKEFLPDTVNVSDDALLDLLNKEITKANAKKTFVVLHTYGSHFNYSERYPRDMAYFTPDIVTSVKKKYKETLINAYDNSIRYTDSFLYRIIKLADSKNISSCILYTSDHGEDLYDDDRNLFLHASPVPTFYQLIVPYILWFSDEYKQNHSDVYNNVVSNTQIPISTNLVTFHSILSIAGIQSKYINNNLSITNNSFVTMPRFFLNDHNEPIAYSKLFFKDEDYAAFKKYSISPK